MLGYHVMRGRLYKENMNWSCPLKLNGKYFLNYYCVIIIENKVFEGKTLRATFPQNYETIC